jgi:hypothetical protein
MISLKWPDFTGVALWDKSESKITNDPDLAINFVPILLLLETKL